VSTVRDEAKCREMLPQIDAFIDNSLPNEARAALLAHVEGCGACAQELEARKGLRTRLRLAVQSTDVPAHLETRVRAHLTSGRRSFPWTLNLAVIAAVLVLAIAFAGYQRGHLRWTAGSKESYIASVSGRVATLMRVGLGDHVHCAVFRKYPKNPPTMAEFAAKLGPSYSGLLPIVRERVPADFRLLLAHQCSYHNRHFVHMVLHSDSALLSVVITRKAEGEAFRSEDLVPALSDAGIAIYRSDVQRFQIAAFESRDHMVYVISDLPAQQNMELMRAMAPALKTYLGNLES